MEGARWDTISGSIADSHLKDLFPAMPVIYIKAVTQDKQDVKNVYECPVFKIRWVFGCSVCVTNELILFVFVSGCEDQPLFGRLI